MTFSSPEATTTPSAPSDDGGKLLEGDLDVDAEQKMFKQAVLDWRKGRWGLVGALRVVRENWCTLPL